LYGVVPRPGERLLYCDHIERMGKELFDLVFLHDRKSIVAKQKFDSYLLDGGVTWLKIRNQSYSQCIGREVVRAGNTATIPNGGAGTAWPQRL
jgi:hypothetical protein